jgi:hypothetical protein
MVVNLGEVRKTDEEVAATTEALQAAFVLSTDMGPLGDQLAPSEEQLAAFLQLTELIKEYLALPLDPRHTKLLENTVRCLVNLPTPCTTHFQPELTLEKLLQFFCFQMNRGEEQCVLPLSLTILHTHSLSFCLFLSLSLTVYQSVSLSPSLPESRCASIVHFLSQPSLPWM